MNRTSIFITGAVALAGSALVLVYGSLSTGTAKTSAVASPPAMTSPAQSSPVVLDDRRQQLTGVRIARVTGGTLSPTIRAAGRVTYDETRLVDVNLKLDGWIQELFVNAVGHSVARGEPLLALYSPDLITAQTQYIAALKNRDVTRPAPGDELGVRLVEAPRLRLQRWDVPEDQLLLIEHQRVPLPAVTFRSPSTGVVIVKDVLQGMHVEMGRTHPFFRLDFRFEKRWQLAAGRWISGTFEWFNATLSKEADSVSWDPIHGGVVTTDRSPLTLPSIGVEAGF